MMPRLRNTGTDTATPEDDKDDSRIVKTTIQLPVTLRRWFKMHAASQDRTLYCLILNILLEYAEKHGYKDDTK